MTQMSSTTMTTKTSNSANTQQNSLLKTNTCHKNYAPDYINSAVSKYLLKRHYGVKHSDNFKRRATSFKTTYSLREMALRQVVENETSSNDCFQFTSEGSSDPRLVEQQYTRFKMLISESPDYYKPELAQLLYPIFTHLYLELINSGKKADAQKFHKKHQSTFLGNVEFAQFIRRLSPITSIEDMLRDEVVSSYFNSRYTVTLSNKTFYYLMKYLYSQYHSNQSGNTIILLQILRTKVDLKLSDALGACSKSEAVQKIKNDLENLENEAGTEPFSSSILNIARTNTNSNPNDSENSNQERLNQIIQAVHQNGPTPLPSTCLYKIFPNNSSSTTSVCISSDFSLMALGCEDSSVTVWDLLPSSSSLDNQPITAIDLEYYNPVSDVPLGCDRSQTINERLQSSKTSEPNRGKKLLQGHCGAVYDVSFVPSKFHKESRDLLLSVSRDKTMRLWNVSEQCNISAYKGHTYPIWSVDVDRLGVNVVTGSMDKTAMLWQLEYTHPIRMYAGHEADVDIVKFHPNCNYIATASSDKTVRLWSHADAKMVRVFSGNTAGIYSLAFSPNGKYLASGGEDRIIRIWDIASSTVLKELKGTTDIIYSLVWSQDSCLLASSGLDSTVRLWDVNLLNSKRIEELQLTNEHNGTANLSGGSLENSTSITSSPELKACYSTTCSNILSLAYSPHNTLIATGIASSPSPTAGISALATLNSNNMRVNKPNASMGLSSNSIVNPSNNQATSAGFTKIFINGTGNNLGK